MQPFAERDAEADRIQRMYEEAEDTLIAMLVAAMATFDEQKVAEAVVSAKAMILDAYHQTSVWHDEAIPSLYGDTNPLAAASMSAVRAASERRFADMTATVTRRIDDLAENFYSQKARWDALARFQAARKGTRIGVSGLANDMESHLRESGITGFTDAAGRRWKLSTYADMAARTTTMEAQNSGVKDRIVSRGDDLVNIIGPLDYPDGCPPAVLDGPYSITGATTEYEGRPIITLAAAFAKYGVGHPRCRHSLAAV